MTRNLKFTFILFAGLALLVIFGDAKISGLISLIGTVFIVLVIMFWSGFLQASATKSTDKKWRVNFEITDKKDDKAGLL